ncbi:MAG TPA: FmdB family zinc ribbon protein [Nitrospira sp.]
MPLYEYRCLDCQKRSTILLLSLTNPKPIACTHCQSSRLERLLSRFASPKSDEARLASLADPDALAGLDENDPESMQRFMKKMGDEMGEDLGDDMAEAMDSPDSDRNDMEGIDGL